MNERKVCFITCVNDREAYTECVTYIQELHVPTHFELELISIEDAASMTQGYQSAMEQSDAKYKVYLHQDVLIVNKNFISDMVEVFGANSELGIIGVTGAKTIPSSGIWWESSRKVGKVYDSCTGNMKLLSFLDVTQPVEMVTALDGLILITQYDIAWNSEVFDGWHYYDLAQCMEFTCSGYKVGIPRQENPWVIHDCGIVNVSNGFEEYREKFLQTYGTELFPKVSVLIPTYNRPGYFELALQSVLNQTYPYLEIVICDDSTNNETEKLMASYLQQYPQIRYYKNEKNLGQFKNDIKCMELARGEFVNFLMDDDLFHHEKLEKMMRYFINDVEKEISLITSYRQLIDGDGKFLNDIGSTKRLFEQDAIIDGISFGDAVLALPVNVIGEPTTVLFRKDRLQEPFGVFEGRAYICNVDLASWANLMSNGKVIYIAQSLSYFRLHGGQQQQSETMITGGTLDQAHMIANAAQKGFFSNKLEYYKHIASAIEKIDNVLVTTNLANDDAIKIKLINHRKLFIQESLDSLEERSEKANHFVQSIINANSMDPVVEYLTMELNQLQHEIILRTATVTNYKESVL